MIINKNQKEAVKNTYKKLIFVYLFWIVLFSITFYKTKLTTNLIVSTSLFMFYILVPYILLVLLGKIYSIKEFLIFAATYLAIILVSSYYIAIIGLNVKYHFIALPCLVIAGAYAIRKIRDRKLKKD
ncbi:hypothetical protein A3K73_01810 [Candidatus Pacearchaeota archaeon RBG_13_36_9]|nr:MAG: hypothetical protein A3K73_01810 [Candidatus Pacearchaeota archaeon RBG_13_36_9]